MAVIDLSKYGITGTTEIVLQVRAVFAQDCQLRGLEPW